MAIQSVNATKILHTDTFNNLSTYEVYPISKNTFRFILEYISNGRTTFSKTINGNLGELIVTSVVGITINELFSIFNKTPNGNFEFLKFNISSSLAQEILLYYGDLEYVSFIVFNGNTYVTDGTNLFGVVVK